jgi:hypothetical protein
VQYDKWDMGWYAIGICDGCADTVEMLDFNLPMEKHAGAGCSKGSAIHKSCRKKCTVKPFHFISRYHYRMVPPSYKWVYKSH